MNGPTIIVDSGRRKHYPIQCYCQFPTAVHILLYYDVWRYRMAICHFPRQQITHDQEPSNQKPTTTEYEDRLLPLLATFSPGAVCAPDDQELLPAAAVAAALAVAVAVAVGRTAAAPAGPGTSIDLPHESDIIILCCRCRRRRCCYHRHRLSAATASVRLLSLTNQ